MLKSNFKAEIAQSMSKQVAIHPQPKMSYAETVNAPPTRVGIMKPVEKKPGKILRKLDRSL